MSFPCSRAVEYKYSAPLTPRFHVSAKITPLTSRVRENSHKAAAQPYKTRNSIDNGGTPKFHLNSLKFTKILVRFNSATPLRSGHENKP